MHNENTIINAVMLPSVLKDNGVTIKLETNYLFENKMHYSIDSDKDFNFAIRIPSFAKNLKVNGKDAETNDLYALQMGSLLFSVSIEYEKKMREYTKKGVERKFPYCDYEFIPQTPWNYGYSNADFEVSFNGISDVSFSQDNPPITIKANMQQINWGLKFPYKSVARKTPKSRKPISEVKKIDLCPYGCARLRMTEMPILD